MSGIAEGPKSAVLLSAFSKKVGHRPTGLQRAQARLFVERFPTEFGEMSMQKIVLPCSKEDQPLPFVIDGGLMTESGPSQVLSRGPPKCSPGTINRQ